MCWVRTDRPHTSVTGRFVQNLWSPAAALGLSSAATRVLRDGQIGRRRPGFLEHDHTHLRAPCRHGRQTWTRIRSLICSHAHRVHEKDPDLYWYTLSHSAGTQQVTAGKLWRRTQVYDSCAPAPGSSIPVFFPSKYFKTRFVCYVAIQEVFASASTGRLVGRGINTQEHMDSGSRHRLVGISVGSLGSLVVKADADTVRIRAAWKSEALISTDDSAPFHKAVLCVCMCVCGVKTVIQFEPSVFSLIPRTTELLNSLEHKQMRDLCAATEALEVRSLRGGLQVCVCVWSQRCVLLVAGGQRSAQQLPHDTSRELLTMADWQRCKD